MEFRKGFKIKPKEVASDGRVKFTDGTNDIVPDQISCEAYGYKFDNSTGTCYAFKNKIQLEEQLKEDAKKKQEEEVKKLREELKIQKEQILERAKQHNEKNSNAVSQYIKELLKHLDNDKSK